MSNQPLKEKLRGLQCHFTWDFEIKDALRAVHILKTLDIQVEHTFYRNRGAYLAMKAYLHHLQGDYREALGSLRNAEEALRREHPTNFSRQVLVTYGNYAWIYYHLTNYEMVELYLGRIREICHALSSPEPYSAEIPEILAQKGWSLLAGGFRNGPEAKECFLKALGNDESNEEYQAGLAFSVYASFTHDWNKETEKEAQRLLEEIIDRHPQNYEAKVYLARSLMMADPQRTKSLVEDVVQNSLNPEVLRIASRVCKQKFLSEAISILKQAKALDPSYHLLHYDLGLYYMEFLEMIMPSEEREETIAAAIESFQRSLEADPLSVFSQLKLAKLYGEKSLAYEEEIYQNLLEDLPSVSTRCQEAIYLHWGDFLLHKKGKKEEALEAYKTCYRICGDQQLDQKMFTRHLENLERKFRENSEMDNADVVYGLLRELGRQDPRGVSRGDSRSWR